MNPKNRFAALEGNEETLHLIKWSWSCIKQRPGLLVCCLRHRQSLESQFDRILKFGSASSRAFVQPCVSQSFHLPVVKTAYHSG